MKTSRNLSALALVLALAGVGPVTPVSAQSIPIVQSGAGGRFERQIDPKTKVEGANAAQVGAFRTATGRLIAQLSTMPSVNAPPAPVCHRLMSWVGVHLHASMMTGTVSVFSPIKFENGRCHPMTGGGIEFTINRFDAGLGRDRAQFADAENGATHWFVMKPDLTGNRLRLRDGTILIGNGRPMLLPVSAKRFAPAHSERWGNPLDPRFVSGPAAERQACFAESMLKLDDALDCPETRKVWEVNPAYFDTKRPGDIQLMALRTPQGPYHGESAERYKARQAMIAALDWDQLAAMVR